MVRHKADSKTRRKQRRQQKKWMAKCIWCGWVDTIKPNRGGEYHDPCIHCGYDSATYVQA